MATLVLGSFALVLTNCPSSSSNGNGTGSFSWHLATDYASWEERYDHEVVVFNDGTGDKLWLFGGWDSGPDLNDVWWSYDGETWSQATASAGWSTRHKHESLVYDDGSGIKIWVLGGLRVEGPTELNDVWYSSDGITWNSKTLSASWSGRYWHTAVIHSGKMWVLGGKDSTGTLNDVYWSVDGASWTLATSSAAWSKRDGHTSVAFADKIWVLGGDDGSVKNDVWWSDDGISWNLATSHAGWSSRKNHETVVFEGKIWVIGGFDGMLRNDMWWSEDGINWTEVTDTAGWSARELFESVVYHDKIWVLGGHKGGGVLTNDVWYYGQD